MKLLILAALFFHQIAFAQTPPVEMPAGVNANKFVSGIKEAQIENQLANSTEFQNCVKKAKYNPSANAQERANSLKAAEGCFKAALPTDKNALIEFSNNLGLQQYGLIQSTNIQEVTKFLSDKMYLAMTGVDRSKQKLDGLLKAESFKNRKMVDQRDFLDLYKTQLTKNALFEISRFCFEDLRLANGSQSDNFADYWNSYFKNPVDSTQVTDLGSPQFFKEASNGTSKADIYKNYVASIGTDKLDPNSLSGFFTFCTKKIGELCSIYEAAVKAATDQTKIPPVGSKACVTRERMRGIKKAMSDTEKLAQNFDNNYRSGKFSEIHLDGGVQLNRFNKNDPNSSVDELTNYSSADFLGNGESDIDKKAQDCQKDPERPECEQFMVTGDKEETLYNVSLKMRLKDQAEIARIKKMKMDNDAGLEEYLRNNGYNSLIETAKKDSAEVLEEKLGDLFNAKREALLASMDKTLSRQIKDPTKTDNPPGPSTIKTAVEDAAKESLDERQRLGQVVLFNNIITSHLELQKKTSNGFEALGMRNTKAMEVELKGQQTAQVDQSLFDNLKDNSGSSQQTNFEDISLGSAIFDPILGPEPEKTP
jgi:hypothetical protein